MAEDEVVEQPFLLAFGIKSAVEVVIDGITGVLTVGAASKYNVVDQDGEYQVPGSFKDIGDTWWRQAKPMVLYNHGFDPVLSTSPIGWGTKYELTDDGLIAECFIPRDPQPPLEDPAKQRRYKEIYNDILARRTRGYSVGGVFKRAGKALVQWSMTELTITPTPCLAVATFGLGQKAVKSMLDNPYGFSDPTIGDIPMDDWSSIMNTAQTAKDHGLHDFLVHNYPIHNQGKHSAASCPVCSDRRDAGQKAAAPDGDYLVIDDKGGQHLRVRKNGTPDHGLMGEAYAALTSNFRGNPYEGPDKSGSLSKLKALYAAEKMDWPGSAKGKKAGMCTACAEQGAGCKACTCAACNDEDPDNGCLCEQQDAGAKAIRDAESVLRSFIQGTKAGAQHSKQTMSKIQKIIDMLNEMITLQKKDLAHEAGESNS